MTLENATQEKILICEHPVETLKWDISKTSIPIHENVGTNSSPLFGGKLQKNSSSSTISGALSNYDSKILSHFDEITENSNYTFSATLITHRKCNPEKYLRSGQN